MRVDLHLHSTASDGAYTPSEVVQIAVNNQVDVIALTDHDTIDGIQPAQQAAVSTPVQVLAGVELSAEDEAADRHILGYLLNVAHPELLALLTTLKNARIGRVERMLAKLEALGLRLSLEGVLRLANGGSVGRPHLARAMLGAGLVGSLQEAFERYIGDGGPAYEPHYRLEPAHAIQTIHRAGGVAVLAHPGRYANYRSIVEELVPLGLDGLEVYYPDHTPEISADLRALAHRYGLVMTAGSDFHRRESDGSARIGTVKYPAELDIIGMLRERAAQHP